jgi:hypothetical protein
MMGRYRTGVLSIINGGLRSGPPVEFMLCRELFCFLRKGVILRRKEGNGRILKTHRKLQRKEDVR